MAYDIAKHSTHESCAVFGSLIVTFGYIVCYKTKYVPLVKDALKLEIVECANLVLKSFPLFFCPELLFLHFCTLVSLKTYKLDWVKSLLGKHPNIIKQAFLHCMVSEAQTTNY